MKKKLFHIILALTIFLPQYSLQAQGTIIDQVIAIVGDRTILQSDIENQYMQYRAQGYNMPDLKCVIFKDMLEQMLLIDQAKIDSIEIFGMGSTALREIGAEILIDPTEISTIGYIEAFKNLKEHFKNFSIDAESGLRNRNDWLDFVRLNSYLKKSSILFL